MWSDDLRLALSIADRADAITMAHFTGRPLPFVTKPDGSPMSDCDHMVEEAIRAAVAAHRPEDGFTGEETGSTGRAQRRWIVDPIDGTREFVSGGRRWASQIALEVHGRVIVGVPRAPALGSRWWGARGGGALSHTPGSAPVRDLHASHISDPASARWTCHPPIEVIDEDRRSLAGRLGRWATYRPPTSHGALMVAEGEIEICLQVDGAAWDYAAFAAIVEPSGGAFSYLDGSHTLTGVSPALLTNGHLHTSALNDLAKR